ncbi:hypothetical protein [Allomuricauda sp. SCSIO 65647]|uniref:hypothetical protein n=1 Tax=Allomuricauda sp. SCSIO 65647 TaxID=2908843 RepID=UPI001F1CB82F|nr:hypothetical protein [Muricauda sp. SCSIO 65647]UJH66918.1 hypothetical protein L0P89_13255 [Muricauda sp. SCSIO 65647]
MKKDGLQELFDRLQGQFDFEEPKAGHQERFLEKLNRSKGLVTLEKKETRSVQWWKPLSIAASIALIAVLAIQVFVQKPTLEEQVVKIAPEVSETQFYFASLIEEQVQELKDAKSPETAKMVDDTLAQLDRLETDYKQLEQDLVNGGNSKIILNAMIINFQTRIDLLKEVLTNIEEVKNLNPYDDANYTI